MIKHYDDYNVMKSTELSSIVYQDHQGRVWFVRLYGKIIHECQRVDYRPYRRTNHTLTSLFAPVCICTLYVMRYLMLNFWISTCVQ